MIGHRDRALKTLYEHGRVLYLTYTSRRCRCRRRRCLILVLTVGHVGGRIVIRLHELRRILVLRIRDRTLCRELRDHRRIHVDRRCGEAAGIVGLMILIQLADLRGVERRRLRELRRRGVGEQHARDRRLREGVRSRIRRDAGRHRVAQILHVRYTSGERRSAVSVERGLRTAGMIGQVLHATALQRAHHVELGLGAADRLVTVFGARIRQQRMPHVHDALRGAQRREVDRRHLRHRVLLLLLLLERLACHRKRTIVVVPLRDGGVRSAGRRVVLSVQNSRRRGR